MTVEIENTANTNMHYGTKPPVINYTAPDKLPAKIVYSPREADVKFKEIQNDIYQGEKKAKPLQTNKFPMILKILLGGAGLYALLFKGKTVFNAVKNIILR